MNSSSLPISRSLGPDYRLAGLVAILMTVASVAGLFASQALYPTQDLRQSFVSNDVVNLALGLPLLLLGALVLARRVVGAALLARRAVLRDL